LKDGADAQRAELKIENMVLLDPGEEMVIYLSYYYPGFNHVRKGIKDGLHNAFVAASEYAKVPCFILDELRFLVHPLFSVCCPRISCSEQYSRAGLRQVQEHVPREPGD